MLSVLLLSVLCDSEVCRSCLQFVGLGIPADNGGAVSRLCTKSITRLRFGSGQGWSVLSRDPVARSLLIAFSDLLQVRAGTGPGPRGAAPAGQKREGSGR